MSTLVYNTDTSNGTLPSFEIQFSSSGDRENLTYGAYIDAPSLDVGFDSYSIEKAVAHGLDLEDRALARALSDLLSILVSALETYYDASDELRSLPPLHVYPTGDGSLIVEWVADLFRAGFGIGPTVDKSSWFLATTEELGSLTSSGSLQPDEIKPRALWLIDFVMSNA